MVEYWVGREGFPGGHFETFGSDKEFKKFCKKFGLIGYKGRKQPFSKSEWLFRPKYGKK